MKRTVTTLAIALIACGMSFAQDTESIKGEYDAIFLAIEGEKKDIVEASVYLEDDEADAFWSLYNEYEKARRVIGDRRTAIYLQYLEKKNEMSPESKAALLSELFDLNIEAEIVRKKIVRQMMEKVNPNEVIHFFMIDRWVQAKARAYILEGLRE